MVVYDDRSMGNENRTITVCIDSYNDGILKGRFYNPCIQGGKTFKSLSQFFLELEQLLDKMEFPKPFTITRTFVGNPEQENGPPEVEFWPGSIATFKVRVLFRQNASWQGSVAWLDGKQEQGFRSALELFMLLDNALTSGQESCAS